MRNKTVLLAATQEAQRKLMRSLLLSQNVAVHEADTAQSSLEFLRRQKPDLIIIELELLFTAIQAAHLLQVDPRWADIPMIALTNNGSGEERKAMSAGCDAYLNMPVDSQSFLKSVNRFLFKKQLEVIAQVDSSGLETGKILVHSSPFEQKAIEDILVQNNFQSVTVPEESKILDTATVERPDVILLDMALQEDGILDLIKKLKDGPSTQHIPVVLMVPPESQEMKSAGLSAGAEDFLIKPFRPIELLVRVEAMINLRKYRTQAAGPKLVEGGKPAGDEEHKEPASDQEQLTVLLVGNVERELRSARNALKSLPLKVEDAATGIDALEHLRVGKVQLVILDYLLPDLDSLEFFKRLKEAPGCQLTPVIVVTCADSEDIRVKCAEVGIDDCFCAPVNNREFRARTKSLLEQKSRLDKMSSQLKVAMRSAIIDWSTGLHSRDFFNAFLSLEVRRSVRQNYPISLILVDIDHFQAFNDNYGTPAGDALLRELSLILRQGVRDIDLTARLGGDEFGIILPYCDRAGAFMVAQRIKQDIQSHHFFYNSITETDKISVSMGISMFPGDTGTPNEMIEKAEMMMHLARHKGLNQIGL